MKTRLLAIFRLLALIVGRYALHGLLSVVLSRRLAEARRGRLHRRTARHFVRTATRLGGVLIKVGQFLSTRVDVLPEAFTEELAKLQDRVPPVDYPVIRARLREELGQDPETVFIHFVPTPLAAASLGQVHEAMLPNGARVAVKVQYPAISELVETDLRALGWATKLLQWWVPTIRFDLLHQEFCHLLSQELDYLQEGRSADTFRANFSGDPRIVVPRIFWEFTTPRVLTLEFIDGIKITNVEELTAKGVSLPALARLVVDAYMVQLLEHRFFHGDPHPGNLFVQPHPDGPKLAFVDFGIMQPMDPALYRAVKGGMQAVIDRDLPGIVRRLKDLGILLRTAHPRDVEQLVVYLMAEYRDKPPRELRELTVEDLARDVRQVLRAYPYLQLPNHFIMLGRTVGMLSGLNAHLDPELNLIELATPAVKRFLLREEGTAQTVVDMALSWGQTVLRLPGLMEAHLAALQRGELRSRLNRDALEPWAEQFYVLAQRGLWALLTLVAFGLWVWLRRQGDPDLAWVVGVIAAGAAVLLLFSLRRRRGHS